jgi:hypothetical protein
MQSIHSPSGRRAAAAISLALATLALSGCNAWVVQSVPPRESLGHQVEQAQVRTVDGKRQVLMFPQVRGDRIVGLRAIATPVNDAVLHQRQFRQAYDTVTIPLENVRSVALTRKSATRTALFFGAVGGVVAAVLGASGPSNPGL